MTNVGMRSDFLRYLLLSVEGGVYSDTDTLAIKSVDNWIDLELRDKVRLVVGIEFDRLDGPWWGDIPHELQFCQWTIAAAPGHPVFQKMVNRTLVALDELSVQQGGAPIPDLKLESMDVMNTTGPAAWTDAVFLQLQEYEPALFSVRDLAFMTEPRLIGDVLVLPIDAFGMGQLHSNSTNDGTIPRAALIKHEFYGSWRPDEYEYQ
jgi:alpha 1,6-mannosyltransferase